MDKIAALTPLVVMGVAFCAVAVAVYRFAKRESAAEEREDAAVPRLEDAPPDADEGGAER